MRTTQIRHPGLKALLGAGMFALATNAALAGDAKSVLSTNCGSCHALVKPEPDSVERVLTRKAPDLFYAGLKFNRPWLVDWLQSPSRLRPGGAVLRTALKAGEAGSADVIDQAKLSEHPKVSAADASALADALLELGAGTDLVRKGAFQPPQGGMSSASLLFGKLRGCGACHTTQSGAGGMSGVELGTAGDRLQADFIYEYIKNPRKFEPHGWMPSLELTDADAQKLTAFVVGQKKGGAK